MNKEFLILSDLHLEIKEDQAKNALLVEINNKIEINKKNNKELIVLLAGDIDNSDMAYGWISKIQAKVVYIAGNHEFWESDFYEVREKLNKNAPSNTSFLYNDFVHIDDFLIIGTTLWTDVGKSLNPSLFDNASFKMNDIFKISAKSWYEDQSNLGKFKGTYPDYLEEQLLKNKNWNTLIEIEENSNAIDFLNAFNHLHDLLTKSESSISSPYFKKDLTFLKGVKKSTSFDELKVIVAEYEENEHRLFEKQIIDVLKNDKYFKLLEDLKQIKNLGNKKIILMTHHLPFYEELFLPNVRPVLKKQKREGLVLNYVEPEIFSVRSGTEYNHHYNYLFECSKGRLKGPEDITRVVNYLNNGSSVFSQSFIDKVNLFVHGHDHSNNHFEMIKGRYIAANPGAGWFFNALSFENNETQINKTRLSGIKDEDVDEIKNQIIENSLLTISDSIFEKEMDNIVNYWVFYNFNRIELLKTLTDLENRYNSFQNALIDYKKQNNSSKEQVKIIYESIQFKESRLEDLMATINLAIKVRQVPGFSMNDYLSTKYRKSYELAENLLMEGDFLGNKSFLNIDFTLSNISTEGENLMFENFKKIKKIKNAIFKIKKLNGIFKSESCLTVGDIDQLSLKKVKKLLHKVGGISFFIDKDEGLQDEWELFKKENGLDFTDQSNSWMKKLNF